MTTHQQPSCFVCVSVRILVVADVYAMVATTTATQHPRRQANSLCVAAPTNEMNTHTLEPLPCAGDGARKKEHRRGISRDFLRILRMICFFFFIFHFAFRSSCSSFSTEAGLSVCVCVRRSCLASSHSYALSHTHTRTHISCTNC